MNIVLSRTLRRLLDSVPESLEHRSDVKLSPEHRDLLQKQFDAVSDYMEQAIAHAFLGTPAVTALQITEELDQQIEQISMDLFSDMDRDFIERILGPLEVELSGLRCDFRAAMIRLFAEAAEQETLGSTTPPLIEQTPRVDAARISVIDELLNRMIQLLTDLERNKSLDWSQKHMMLLDQRLYDIHDNIKHHFVRGGILPPSDAASRLSDRLFYELGDLMTELTEDSDKWWTPRHCQHVCELLHNLHRQFDELLDHAVESVWHHQAALLPSDIMHHIVTALTECEDLLSHFKQPNSEGTRAHRMISSLLNQLTTKGETL